jgi:excisionase family DNA binding protein
MPRSGQRDWAKERRWRKVFADWEVSALSAAEYCRQHNIKYCQFQDWRKTFARRAIEGERKTAEQQREQRERMAARKEANVVERETTHSRKRVTRQPKQSSELLTREEAAAYLGIASQTLAIWRSTGRYHLPSVKVGRLVRYRRSDLDTFLASRTSDQSPRESASESQSIQFAEVRLVDRTREEAPVSQKETGSLELSFPGGMTLRIGADCPMDLLASVVSLLGGR